MRKGLCILLAGLAAACLAACSGEAASAPESAVEMGAPAGEAASSQGAAQPSGGAAASTGAASSAPEEGADSALQDSFYVTVEGETFAAAFADNAGAEAFRELLAEGDLVIQMSDYGGFEKVGALGQDLPAENSQTTTQAGDIVLYQGDQIVLFYGSNTWSYTRLGRVHDLTGWQEALGSGAVSAVFSLEG